MPHHNLSPMLSRCSRNFRAKLYDYFVNDKLIILHVASLHLCCHSVLAAELSQCGQSGIGNQSGASAGTVGGIERCAYANLVSGQLELLKTSIGLFQIES